MTDKEKEEIEFAHTEAANAIDRYFEVVAEKRKLLKQIVELGIEKDKAVDSAQSDMAKKIFKEMYEVVNESRDATIIVTADDVKRIAKRYGVKL